MNEEIKLEYLKIQDKITEEDFLERMDEMKKEYNDVSFMSEIDLARMIVGKFIDEKNDMKSESKEHVVDKINKLESGLNDISIIGRVMKISNPKKFKTRQGKEGKLCNVVLADDTGEIRVVLWTENIKLLKKFNEGDIIKLNKVEIKDGYKNSIEAHTQPRSTIEAIDINDSNNEFQESSFPEYGEAITPIFEISPETNVNIIARITRIPKIRKFDKNGKEGKVCSLELQDETGKISYTLWNRDVELIEDLGLNEGDSVKIIDAAARERNDEVSLSHWDGKIVKGEYDVPDYNEEIIKISEAHKESKDISLIGILTRIQDTITFERQDGNQGSVRSIEITDDTGSIRVSLWGDDTNIELKKGDIVKISGANVESDEYSPSGYKVNTNWNSRIQTNPEGNEHLIELLKEYKNQLGPIPINQIQEIEEDGQDVDVIGRVITINDTNEFQREDGTVGVVRSIDFSDASGMVRLSFWDDKANISLNEGQALLIENARTKMGLYSVDLNIGKMSRVIKLEEDEVDNLPSYAELEAQIYTTKKVNELEEDDRNIKLLVRIIDLQDPREFQRQDGTPGMLRSVELGDDTGSIRGTLWDDKANTFMEIGDAIKIENPGVTYRDYIELNLGRSTKISKLNDEDAEELPSFKELQEIIYQSKNIEDLEDDDRNIKVSGKISEAFGNRILINKCPQCNAGLEQVGDEFICDVCGESIEQPKYLLMVPTRIEDESGDIRVTFFDKLAENILKMSTEEVVGIINESGDEGALEGKVEELVGLQINLIADTSFDEYNEELRLNPKKIISLEL
ncbi:MAG: OB-fold nucleic acid binding domain-containing protein [Methanobacteriaceae archaeon]